MILFILPVLAGSWFCAALALAAANLALILQIACLLGAFPRRPWDED